MPSRLICILFALTVLPASSTMAQTKPAAPVAVMETAFKKFADPTSLLDAKNAGYVAIQMHTGMPAAIRKKPIDQSISLEIATAPSIVQAWKDASKKHDIKIISLCAGSLNKCQIWDRDREVAMRIAKQTIDACETLDVHTMLFPFFGPSDFQTNDDAFNGIMGFMKELLPYAAAKKVTIGIEAPVTTVRVMQLIEAMEFPDNLKVYYDTGNLFAKEDVYATIRKYAKDHFCEIHIKPAGNSVVGKGQIDLAKLASALDDGGYDKWLVYESSRDGKDPIGNRKSIQEIISLRK